MMEQTQVAGTMVFKYEVPRSAMRMIDEELAQHTEERINQVLFEPGPTLAQIIHDCTNDAFSRVGADTSEVTLHPTQVWLNRVLINGMHTSHLHQNSILSGILYLQNSDLPTVFHRRTLYADLPIRWWVNPDNEWEGTSVNAIRGMVVIFPSNLHHYVPPNKTGEDRLVVAWNTWPRGVVMAQEDKLCKLHLK